MSNVHLTGIARDLAAHAEKSKTIRIGVIGSGEMGTSLPAKRRENRCALALLEPVKWAPIW